MPARRPRHIVVGDDGSEPAARARALALSIAEAAGARLTIVYVRQPLETVAQAERKLARAVVAAARAGVRCSTATPPPVGITNPGRRIVAVAAACKADLIVVGARGAGFVGRMLGSVSRYVVSRAPVSVCVVR